MFFLEGFFPKPPEPSPQIQNAIDIMAAAAPTYAQRFKQSLIYSDPDRETVSLPPFSGGSKGDVAR
jgi:hypothetical protein